LQRQNDNDVRNKKMKRMFLGAVLMMLLCATEMMAQVGARMFSVEETTRNAAPQAPTIHIVASNFLGGVDIKN
jgi:hypothetical protein